MLLLWAACTGDRPSDRPAPEGLPGVLGPVTGAVIVEPEDEAWGACLPPAPAVATGRIDEAWALAGTAAIKVGVRVTGLVRLGRDELVAAGLRADVDPRRIAMSWRGRPIPILISGAEDGRFDPGDVVEFVGFGNESLYADVSTYWLHEADGPLRMDNADSPNVTGRASTYPCTVERRDRTLYFAALRNGEGNNMFGPIVKETGIELTVGTRALATSGTAALEVHVQGVSAGVHTVMVRLNGQALGTVSFPGQESTWRSFPVDAAQLLEGANLVTLTSSGPADTALFDRVRLTYPRQFAVTGPAADLWLLLPAQSGADLEGFAVGTRLFDVSQPEAPRLAGSGSGQQPLRAGAQARTVLAVARGRERAPATLEANRPSRWFASDQRADLVVLAPRVFLDVAAPLVELRRKQGFEVALIDVDDLYDEFSFGEKTPLALRRFLAHASARWQRPPRFVLLFGNATFDPRNLLGKNVPDHVPTKLYDSRFHETATDDWVADFDDDFVPELAVGRLPVRTRDEAEAVVSKLVRAQGVLSGPARGVLFVLDQRDEYNDFDAMGAMMRDVVPVGVPVTTIARGDADGGAPRPRVMDELARGPFLVHYLGHGSQGAWAGNMLTDSDGPVLSNGDRPFFLSAMTCLNGWFHDVYRGSLAATVLTAPRGGALAVWASTTLTEMQDQAPMFRAATRDLFRPGLTIGELTLETKARATETDVRRSWILFGDPTTFLTEPARVAANDAGAGQDGSAKDGSATTASPDAGAPAGADGGVADAGAIAADAAAVASSSAGCSCRLQGSTGEPSGWLALLLGLVLLLRRRPRA